MACLRFFQFHEWNKWEQYPFEFMLTYVSKNKTVTKVEQRECRTCKRCGHMQDREVGPGYGKSVYLDKLKGIYVDKPKTGLP